MTEKRFIDSEYKELRKMARFKEVSLNFFNKKIKVPDSGSLIFLNRELFGQEIYKFESSSKTPFIIDCGANIGLSLIYFKKIYPNAKIIAFEPDKRIFNYLKYNINSFEFNNIELINKGLWKEETTLKFFSEGSDGGRIAIKDEMDNLIQIETVTLSTYLRNNKVDFLKIDIEGAETEVLLECQNELKNVKNLFIEYHSFKNEKQSLSVILNILEDNGFRYYIEHVGVKSDHPFCNILTSAGFDNQLNIFGYKNEK
ncbi:MAG: FkbM family methyltransferase [Arcobacter sp.]|uniref:FkbM family methyltransferase n=1 Tax=uncultured Arcobacter sp. TaxID=165434 RepID=UPI000CB46E14|nr:FkbM family methyltransferase [uncultured Arcobacter sp.]PLY08718.1 MAG: FkbM family methyltransferase [Arcobacter sp.]